MTADVERIRLLTDAVRKNDRSLAALARRVLTQRGVSASHEEVEDVLSDAYLRAATRLRNEPRLQVENYAAWFSRFVFFTCLRRARELSKLPVTIDLDGMEMQDQMLDMVPELLLTMDKLLESLDPTDQKIVMRAAEGFTSKEIAGELGGNLSEASVRQKKSRALRKLLRRYQGADT